MEVTQEAELILEGNEPIVEKKRVGRAASLNASDWANRTADPYPFRKIKTILDGMGIGIEEFTKEYNVWAQEALKAEKEAAIAQIKALKERYAIK